MPTLTVLMGPPGAGKTTWTEANPAPGRVLCSTERLRRDDAMRGRPGAAIKYLALLRARADEALRAGRSVLIDGCNTRRSDRSTWLGLARKHGALTELIVFDTPLELMLEAQRGRKHPVPEGKVRGYFEAYQRAQVEARREGWGQIRYVRRAAPQPRRVSTW